MTGHRIVTLAAAMLGLASSCAHQPAPVASAVATPIAAPAKTATVDMQGGRPSCKDPLVKGFYEITLVAFAKGPANVDLPSYQQKSYAHFRANAASMGGNPEGLVDHLKGIPGQLIQIVKEDPKVLESCNNFLMALAGPP